MFIWTYRSLITKRRVLGCLTSACLLCDSHDALEEAHHPQPAVTKGWIGFTLEQADHKFSALTSRRTEADQAVVTAS
jgi:hypothetical protein